MFNQESIYFTVAQTFQYDGGVLSVRFNHTIGVPEYSWAPWANHACGTVTSPCPNAKNRDTLKPTERIALGMFAGTYGLGLRKTPELKDGSEETYLAFYGCAPAMPTWGRHPITLVSTDFEFQYIRSTEYGTRTMTWKTPLRSVGAGATRELRKAVIDSGTGDREYFDNPVGQEILLDVMRAIVEDNTPKEFTAVGN